MYRDLLLTIALVGTVGACHTADTTAPITFIPALAFLVDDVPVTTGVADSDLSIAPTLHVRSDQRGEYSNTSAVVSVVQAVGAWNLNLSSSRNSNRTLFLDFSQAIPGSAPSGGNPIGIPSGSYKANAIAKCNLYGVSMLTLAPGSSVACPLHIGSITYGGATYALQMNPYGNGAGEINAPSSNFATVTCTAGSGSCSAWRVTPSGTYTAPNGTLAYRNVAKLLKKVVVKGKTTTYDMGDFHVSFAINVHNP